MKMDCTPRLAGRLWLVLSFLSCLLCAVGCATATDPSEELEPPVAEAPRAVVRRIAGITPGEMSDADVVGIYGDGVWYGYQDQPADTRLYTDPARRFTLSVGTHTDGMVVVVRLSQGTVLPPGVDPALTTTTALGTADIEHGVELGMTADEVASLLGRPAADQSPGALRVFIYQMDDDPSAAGDITYTATYEFKDDSLYSVEIRAGE